MGKLKWDVDGRGDEPGSGGGFYNGPDLPKGSYTFRVKRMTVGKIKSQGENHGKPRISILLEAVGGAGSNGLDNPEWEFLGAPVWDGLNIIKSGTSFVNGFLHALTDGSEAEKRAVEAAFWPPNGPDARKEKGRDDQPVIHVKKIGKYKVNSPNGELLVQAVVKPDKDLQGNYRPSIAQYIPYTGPGKPKSVDVEDDDDDLLDDVDDDDDMLEDADEDEEEFADTDDEPF